MSQSEQMRRDRADNLEELTNLLRKLSEYATPSTIYTINKYGNPVIVRTIEDTLTDGSKVYNVIFE